jgi:hypothetical protein
MQLEINWFEPSNVKLGGSSSSEPSNRLNRKRRRFNRRFATARQSRRCSVDCFACRDGGGLHDDREGIGLR